MHKKLRKYDKGVINMKKKLISIILMSFLILSASNVSAVQYGDISEDSVYYDAINVLSDHNIVRGYEDGTFRVDNNITRAEVVALVNRLQGLSDEAAAAGGSTVYTDVAATDWFAGDVNIATQKGFITGDGNGLFRPKNSVKYEEAVKMLVTALGYTQEDALKEGGWPNGYIAIAEENNILTNTKLEIGSFATRGTVALLAYNTYNVLSNSQKAEANKKYYDLKSVSVSKRNIKFNNELKVETDRLNPQTNQKWFEYGNEAQILSFTVTIEHETLDQDETVLIQLKAAERYNREDCIEISKEVLIKKGTNSTTVDLEMEFQKNKWINHLYDSIANEEMAEIWFGVYLNGVHITEKIELFKYNYEYEKSLAETAVVDTVEIAAINSVGTKVQIGNRIIDYANVAKIQLTSNLTFDESYFEENNEIIILPMEVSVYTASNGRKRTLVASLRYGQTPIPSDNINITFGEEYHVKLSGNYIFEVCLFDKVLISEPFSMVKP